MNFLKSMPNLIMRTNWTGVLGSNELVGALFGLIIMVAVILICA